jgi:hypothetical protein
MDWTITIVFITVQVEVLSLQEQQKHLTCWADIFLSLQAISLEYVVPFHLGLKDWKSYLSAQKRI